ncbi:CPBP family intramembrane metalloprotease [Jatrophihabitans telluris]|uniref:CPBP family intramembrane metalloprotease n=1 Tax=Jatrophihabitans telluris TaxID=2038343 RepID=A0ABY4R4P4_9ACTN|nr:type II CAAX endopeptidase family protein [Jatrophihabitans telluris]UQX90223.1 CPBP family intramembrane metalloprotease [Jatrophihabitans telluris]
MSAPAPSSPESSPESSGNISPETSPEKSRRHHGLEILLVLGVSLGISALNSLINFADIQTRSGGFRHAVATLNNAQNPREWVDLSYQLVGILSGVVPALFALYLLSRSPGGSGFGIGFDRLRARWDALSGAGLAALIGLPGIGLVYLARQLGINAEIVASGLADTWYRYPVLVLSGIQNGFYEEIIMVGFLLTRLRQRGWPAWQAILLSAVIRGSYHTYQGAGAFVGNFVMGAIFGYFFTRTRRVLPLVIAHSIIDVASFIGYALLHDKVSWI